MKEKFKNGFLIFLAVLIVGFLLGEGIRELTSKKDRITVDFRVGVAVMDVEHSVAGIIPMGQDHYFLGGVVNDDSVDAYIVRADKDWAKKNFDEDGISKKKKFTVTAFEKRLDYEVEQELTSELAKLEGQNYPIGTTHYLDVNYQSAAIIKLVAGVLFLAAAVLAFVRKKMGQTGKVLTALPLIFVVAGLLIAVFGLR